MTPNDTTPPPPHNTQTPASTLTKVLADHAPKRTLPLLPQTSPTSLHASLTEVPLNTHTLHPTAPEKGKTILYLAYGSNLCAETFRTARGIHPISQANVLVPSLRLTFDLPGIPYSEPCFANTAVRAPQTLRAGYASGSGSGGAAHGSPRRKDRWHKGLVGCVYEVTLSDYAHIIATEGAGSAYEDIVVDCYLLPDGDVVPERPGGMRFKAHTLFASEAGAGTRMMGMGSAAVVDMVRLARPDSSYAQPSARYLKLITDGAAELELPAEYRRYLDGICPYTITSGRQRVGKAVFGAVWLPFLALMLVLVERFQDERGRAPEWLARLSAAVFRAMWMSYDVFWKRVCGDGERTEGEDEGEEWGKSDWEKERLAADMV